MSSSAAPFLPSAGGGGQIGAFPTFPGGPLFADEDGLVTVAAFPPLAAFGFGTFCPSEDQQQQQQQQQLLVPSEQQQHQFLPIQSQFLGDASLSRFAVDETQMFVNMACGTFLTGSSELEQLQNCFPPLHSANGSDTFLPISQNASLFCPLNCAAVSIDRPNSAQLQSAAEVLAKNEKSDDQSNNSTLLLHHQQMPSAAVRRGHPTQRGGMRRRVTERIGKRKMGQNANANLLATITTPLKVQNYEDELKDDVKQMLTTIDDALLKPNTVQPIATVPSDYSVPSSTIVALREEQLLKRCAHCDGDIQDHTMLAVGKASPEFFHCQCLKCSECADLLENVNKCYVRDERIYCAKCYSKNFCNVRCAVCNKPFTDFTDWTRRAREYFYHLTCFKCEHCARQLTTGEQFSLDDLHRPPPAIPRLLCHVHYTELVLGEQCNSKQKTKRVRTTFGEEQLSILQQHFKIDSNPDGADLERIAYLTGLSKRVTQVWFQNSRARQKKYHGHSSCRKSVGVPGGSIAPGSSSASIASGASMDTPCPCRSATLTPSSSSNGARTAGQSPVLFGRGGSTSSESDGFRQILIDAISPSAIIEESFYVRQLHSPVER